MAVETIWRGFRGNRQAAHAAQVAAQDRVSRGEMTGTSRTGSSPERSGRSSRRRSGSVRRRGALPAGSSLLRTRQRSRGPKTPPTGGGPPGGASRSGQASLGSLSGYSGLCRKTSFESRS